VPCQVGTILLYPLPKFLVFVFSFVIVLVFVRFEHCNFYFYIVFVSQVVTILVFVLTERSAIILVFVFITKIALHAIWLTYVLAVSMLGHQQLHSALELLLFLIPRPQYSFGIHQIRRCAYLSDS